MLILSRKKSERIVINDNVELVVIQIRGDRVKLGFEAPNDVSIHRREIFRRIEAEGEQQEPASLHEAAEEPCSIVDVSG